MNKAEATRSFHYGFKQHRAHHVHIADGTKLTVQARSAREATDIATSAGHDVVQSLLVR